MQLIIISASEEGATSDGSTDVVIQLCPRPVFIIHFFAGENRKKNTKHKILLHMLICEGGCQPN